MKENIFISNVMTIFAVRTNVSTNMTLGIPFADLGDFGSAVLNSEQKFISILTIKKSSNPLIVSAYSVLIDTI